MDTRHNRLAQSQVARTGGCDGRPQGNISVGTKLEYHCSIEELPKIFKKPFRTVVEGELFTFFFSAGVGTTFKNGKYTVEAPNNFFRFERLEDDDSALAFRKELGSNPQLKAPSLQYAPPADGKPSK